LVQLGGAEHDVAADVGEGAVHVNPASDQVDVAPVRARFRSGQPPGKCPEASCYRVTRLRGAGRVRAAA
jgi:hypothetical protein